jgi:spore germination protein Q
MNYGSANYTNGQDYYSFPAYRAAGGMPGNMPGSMQGGMQGSMPGGMQGGMPGSMQGGMQNGQMGSQGTPLVPYSQMPATTLPSQPAGTPIQGTLGTATSPPIPGLMPLEQSYIENILRFNLGKIGTFYMTYENNTEWNAKIFRGRIEAAGRDHIIISDPKTGMRFLLLMVNLDYATFDEELKYTSPYQTGNRR